MENLKDNNTINVLGTALIIKMYNSNRVVTFKDIDTVHGRSDGAARKRFNDNKKYFIEGVDYYKVKSSDALMSEKRTLGFDKDNFPNRGLTLLTESGYLMIVKSFTDDKAWEVQRQLVNGYFRLKEVAHGTYNLTSIQDVASKLQKSFADVSGRMTQVEKSLGEQSELLLKAVGNMTLSTVQQGKIHKYAKDRIGYLLGGAHSKEYKENARKYFINLWNGLKATFECGSRWQDLNPANYDDAVRYINEWEYEGD